MRAEEVRREARWFGKAVLVASLALAFLLVGPLHAQDAGSYWTRWEAASKAGDWKKAELAMRDALRAFPGRADFASSLSWALRRQDRAAEAVAFLEPFFAANPADAALREALAYSLLDVGWKLYDAGKKPDALAPFGRSYGLLPADRYAANAYGCALRDVGRVDEAIPVLEKAYAAFPDDEYLRPNLAYAYIVKAQDLAAGPEVSPAARTSAEAFFAKSAALDPKGEAYLLDYGVYLNAAGRFAEALVLLEDCLARYPTNPWVRGDIEYALQETERGLAASGDYAAALRAARAASARFPGEAWLLLDCIDFATKLGDYGSAAERILAFARTKALLDYGKPLERSLEELLKFRIDAVMYKLAEEGRFAEGFAFLDGLKKALPGALYVDESRGVLLFHAGRKEEGITLVEAVYAAWIKGHPEFAKPLTVELPIRGTLLVWGNARKDAVTHAGMSRFCFDFLGSDASGSILAPGRVAPGNNEDYLGFGRDVLAAADGVVVSVEDGFADIPPRPTAVLGDGNSVVVRDARGFLYNYVHIRKGSAAVRVGQAVAAGDKLAELGNTGYTSVPHLHFGVYSPDWRVSIPLRFRGYETLGAGAAWKPVKDGVPATGEIIRD